EVLRGCASQAASAASPTNQEGARESAELSSSSRAIPVKGPGALRGLCRSSAARSGLRHVELEPMGKAVRQARSARCHVRHEVTHIRFGPAGLLHFTFADGTTSLEIELPERTLRPAAG